MSFDTTTGNYFSQTPIGFIPLDSKEYYDLYGLAKTSKGYIISRFVPASGGAGGIDNSNRYNIRVFYI